MIQSFEPGEVDYEKAHEIGRQLADAVTKGQHEYVLTTHIDKGHIHNHIIFCAVNFVDHHKYVSNKRTYYGIRNISDRLCRENGLSVVVPEKGSKGKNYAAYHKEKSAKAKLKIAVDTLIPQVNSFEELLSRLQGLGYNDTRISAVGAEGASVGTIANAANGATFTVTSESSNNVSVYTIKATYADAITSFSVNGVEGVISDSEDPKDNIPDTITVTLPKTAILDKYGDPTVETFKVEYEVYGNVEVAQNDNTLKIDSKVVTSGDEFEFSGLATNETWGTDDNLVVTRLNTATQTYNLVVELEKSDNTAITAARLDNTEATIDGDEISAVLPQLINDDEPTNLGAVKVELTVDATAESVVITGVKKTPSAGKVTFGSVDLNKPQIVTVTAQDKTTQQYTLSATKATVVNDASITAMWLTDGTTKAEGVISGNTITLTVPYMTTSVADWNVYVTPSANAKVLNSNGNDVVNGKAHGSNVGLGAINVTSGDTGFVKAVNMVDQKVFKEYKVVVKLAPAKNGNTLTDLDFTAQQVTTTGTTNDQVVYRNITKDNTFDANVEQATNLSHGLVSMMVPPSLMIDETNSGRPFLNIVTSFETANGGVAYVVSGGNASAGYSLVALDATVDDDDPTNLTGTCLNEQYASANNTHAVFNQIVVLPEEVARRVELNGNTLASADVKYGTFYDVKITEKTAETEALLKTIKVGDTTLTVSGNTIKGELPYSMTGTSASAAPVVNTTWELSKYAKAYPMNATYIKPTTPYAPALGINDLKFVQGDDNKVIVYYNNAELSKFVVRAENRLTNTEAETSTTQYTFELTYADPCADADITSFKLGNYTGSIDGRNITVTVPYGTDVKGMVANFTTSVGAIVELNAYNSGSILVSGVTSVNYSNPVKLYVTSESGNNTVEYTVTVEEGISFSDVNPGDWFYDNVMDAAENGYVSGMGDGTFNPTGATTRAQFAAMIANAMGYDDDPDVESCFPRRC